MNCNRERFRFYVMQFKALFIIAAFLCVQSTDVSAQLKNKFNSKIHYKGGKYHYKKGWINSGGLHILPVAPVIYLDNAINIGGTLPVQFDYTGYLLVNPRLGLGLSVAYTRYATGELGYEYFTHYNFVDYTAYAKYYLSNSRRRLYIDSKLGYGHAASDGVISFGCYGCDDVGALFIRHTSGLKFQSGIGLDFASSKVIKCGIKLSYSANFVTEQRDRHENRWEATSEGIVKRDTYRKTLGALFFGFNIYI